MQPCRQARGYLNAGYGWLDPTQFGKESKRGVGMEICTLKVNSVLCDSVMESCGELDVVMLAFNLGFMCLLGLECPDVHYILEFDEGGAFGPFSTP